MDKSKYRPITGHADLLKPAIAPISSSANLLYSSRKICVDGVRFSRHFEFLVIFSPLSLFDSFEAVKCCKIMHTLALSLEGIQSMDT